jgi:effector-binding domain-containing protein
MATVSEKQVGDQLIASIRKTQPQKLVGSFISASAISLMVYAKELNIDPNGRGFTIHHKIGEEVDIEVCLPVSKSGQDRGDIKFKEVKGGNAASLVFKGNHRSFVT